MSSKRAHDDIEARSEAIESETAADIQSTHHILSDAAQEPAEALPGVDKSTVKRARIESDDNTDVSTGDSLNVHTQASVKTDPVEVGTAGTPIQDTLASGTKTEATTTGIEGSTSESEQAGVKVDEATSVSGVKAEEGFLSRVRVEGTLPVVADSEEDLAQSGIKEEAVAEGFEMEIAEEAGTVKTEDVPEATSRVKSEYTGDTVNTDESIKSEDVALSNVEDEIVPHSVTSENTGEGDHMDTEEAVKTEETPASASASAGNMALDESASASTAQADSTDYEPPEATIERLRQHVAAYRSAMLCSICSEILVKPHSLECGHSYCVTCICTYFSVQKAMGRGLQCKQCNNPIRKKPEPSLVLQTRISILRKQPCADSILKNYSARLKSAERAMKSVEYKSIMPGTELVDHEGKGYVFDKGDDVYRCIECLFEIEDYKCAGCGVAFPELENRSDVHRELGVSDSQEDGEDSEDDEGDDNADLKNFIVESDEEIEMEKPEEGEQPLKGWITNQSGLMELMCGCDVSCGQDCECDDEDCTACPCAQRNLNDGSGEDSDSDNSQDGTHWDGGSDDGSVHSKSDHRGANKDTSVVFKDMSKAQRKKLKAIMKANKVLEANGVENIDSLSKNQRLKLLKKIRADRKAAAKAAKDTVDPNTGEIAEPTEGFVIDRAGAYATENSAAIADGDAVVRGDGEGDNGNREEGELSDTYRNRMNEHSEESRKIHDVKAAWPSGDLVERADGGENIEDGGSDEFESGADEMERDEDDDDYEDEEDDEDEDMEGVEDTQAGEVEEGEVDAEDGEDSEEEEAMEMGEGEGEAVEDGEDLGESDGEDE